MANRIRGITVEIGGDTTKLSKALLLFYTKIDVNFEPIGFKVTNNEKRTMRKERKFV